MFGQRNIDDPNENVVSGAPAVAASGTFNAPLTAPASVTQPTSPLGAPPVVSATGTAAAAAQLYSAPSSDPAASSLGSSGAPGNDELMRMKQEALKQLHPLINSLQQTPEEEFRTLMMMIQATDDKTMLKKALDIAKQITDEKTRAQAMLDVVNEINYFTQTGTGQ